MKTVRLPMTIAAVVGLSLLAGCGGGSSHLSGTYATSRDLIEFTFKDGKVTYTNNAAGGATFGPFDYKVKGKEVILSGNGQTQTLTIDANGCLSGGGIPNIDGPLCKKS